MDSLENLRARILPSLPIFRGWRIFYPVRWKRKATWDSAALMVLLGLVGRKCV